MRQTKSREGEELPGFNSRTLGRVRLVSAPRNTLELLFQFTHPGKGATWFTFRGVSIVAVSIHAPWEGCDQFKNFICEDRLAVSIHAPWEGCDSVILTTESEKKEFQFTHPGKGATTTLTICNSLICCFNSRTLGRVRRIREVLAIPDILFQFTHPGKGATASASAKFFSTWVSIHAPWEGCDLLVADKSNTFFRFNSRTLGRVRRSAPYQILLSVRFQFTHPGKGATVWCCRSADRYLVSIHAPWEGCDPSPWRDLAYTPFGFNSRTLGRVRQSAGKRQYRNYSSFNSRTLGRVRRIGISEVLLNLSFNSRTLGRVRR